MDYFTNPAVIHPENNKEIAYWTKKWGVNVRQINDAILETGSLNLKDIKNVLVEKGEIGTLAFWVNKLFKSPVRI